MLKVYKVTYGNTHAALKKVPSSAVTKLAIQREKYIECYKNLYLCALFSESFYVLYCTFRRSLKEKCPLSGTKTQVQYVNPGTFLLCRYGHVLLFYYIASGTFCGDSEGKYSGTVAKS